MLINRFNFIVWGNTPPEPKDIYNLPEGGVPGVAASSVLLAPLETYSFYINAPNGVNLGGTHIDLVTETNQLLVEANIGSLIPVNAGLDDNQYKGSITVPADLRENYYRLRIGATNNYYYSNRLWYKPDDYDEISVIASYRNAQDILNAYFPYSLVALNNFRTVLRIKCYSTNPQPDDKIEDYNPITGGKRRIVGHEQSVYLPFVAEKTDAIGAEGFRAMLQHKDILLNNNPVTVKSGFTLSSDSRQIATGNFEVWDTTFSLTTRC